MDDTPLEESWADVRPGPEPPERPPLPEPEKDPGPPTLAERARMLFDALMLFSEIKGQKCDSKFEIRLGSSVGTFKNTLTHTSIGQALEELTEIVKKQVEDRLRYARNSRDESRARLESADAEATRIESLVREYAAYKPESK